MREDVNQSHYDLFLEELGIQVFAGDKERLVPLAIEPTSDHSWTLRDVFLGRDFDATFLMQSFHRVGGIIASVGLFITGLSLFVGGIGIMNIMFVSVAERTREIGVRKAIGAKRRTILIQFLIEAAAICLIGGLLGLGIAFPASLVLKRFLPATMSLSVVALAIVIALVTGVISGFLPAFRAARMNPVDALRSE